MILNLTILFFLFVEANSQIKRCNTPNEFQCVNGQCILRRQWCDNKRDCQDGSDEYFCDGAKQCMKSYFKCGDGRCIPESAFCDGIADCPDGLDEKCNERISSETPQAAEQPPVVQFVPPKVTVVKSGYNTPLKFKFEYTDLVKTEYTNAIKTAVKRAQEYILSQRRSDYGWGDPVVTSRAMVALAFTERVTPLDTDEKNLMMKQLNIQLSLDLITNARQSLSHLALYINSLYATCQDPRDFQGLNLVHLLRTETNNAMMHSNLSLPLVMLTLCISGEAIADDVRHLYGLYDRTADQVGSRALTVMAMTCFERKSGKSYFDTYIQDFVFKTSGIEKSNFDVYSKALVYQVYNALGQEYNRQLLSDGRKDGSFGDLLATYYALPALMNTNMIDLKCKTSEQYGTVDETVAESYPRTKEVSYSLWITEANSANISHSTVVSFRGNKTFYDVMKIAESRDPMFKFMCDDSNEGKKVFSIAGIPNDVETGMSWMLYRATSERISLNFNENLRELSSGIDNIFPSGKEHYVFWLKRT